MTNDQIPMTSKDQLAEEVRLLVSKIVKKPLEKVTLGSNLFDELGVDSLLGVEIFAALDKKYGVVIPEELLKGVATLDDLIKLVAAQKK